MKISRRISLVIPVYNQVMHTMQCLESLLRLPEQAHELIIVNNASTDGTAQYLKGIKAHVITNATNLGCAKAWNHSRKSSLSISPRDG